MGKKMEKQLDEMPKVELPGKKKAKGEKKKDGKKDPIPEMPVIKPGVREKGRILDLLMPGNRKKGGVPGLEKQEG
jgi:hypothetical protein